AGPEGQALHVSGMTGERQNLLRGGRIPEFDLFAARRCNRAAVRREGDRMDALRAMAAVSADVSATAQIPYFHCPVAGSTGEELAVGAVGQRGDPIGVPQPRIAKD